MPDTLSTLPVEALAPGENARQSFDPDALALLADSIRDVGVLQPLIVCTKGDGYEIVAGERRWRAAKLAGLATVPCIIRPNGKQGAKAHAAENIAREQLNPVEEARAFDRAKRAGLTPRGIAKACAVSEQLVEARLALLALPESIQEGIAAGRVTLAQAEQAGALGAAALPAVEALGAFVLAGGGWDMADALTWHYQGRPVEKLAALDDDEEGDEEGDEEEPGRYEMPDAPFVGYVDGSYDVETMLQVPALAALLPDTLAADLEGVEKYMQPRLLIVNGWQGGWQGVQPGTVAAEGEALGVLVEAPAIGRYGARGSYLIADGDWLRDAWARTLADWLARTTQERKRAKKAADQQARRDAQLMKRHGIDPSAPDAAAQLAKITNQAERAKAKTEREKIQAENVATAEALAGHSVKLTQQTARELARILFSLAGQGTLACPWVATDPAWKPAKKQGAKEHGERLALQAIETAKTGEEALSFAVRSLLASTNMDVGRAPYYATIPGQQHSTLYAALQALAPEGYTVKAERYTRDNARGTVPYTPTPVDDEGDEGDEGEPEPAAEPAPVAVSATDDPDAFAAALAKAAGQEPSEAPAEPHGPNGGPEEAETPPPDGDFQP